MLHNDFELGYEHYQKREYQQAACCFMQGLYYDWNCINWLGYCYDYGFGVEQDLMMAKDLYTCYYRLVYSPRNETPYLIRLRQRIDRLQHIPDCQTLTRHIEGIGNVRVTKSQYGYPETSMRFNQDEIVVTIGRYEPLLKGISHAQHHAPEQLAEWTCDGHNRYYDGYTLRTDYFHLQVLRGTTDRYVSHINGEQCQLFFPKNACPDYLYVQKNIHSKVRDLLYKRAKEVLPEVLQRVSERIHVPYQKCEIVKSLRACAAYNQGRGRLIALSTTCLQLPKESLEALCIHELAHNFVGHHGAEFRSKLIELGGERTNQLDQNRWHEGKWRYLRI